MPQRVGRSYGGRDRAAEREGRLGMMRMMTAKDIVRVTHDMEETANQAKAYIAARDPAGAYHTAPAAASYARRLEVVAGLVVGSYNVRYGDNK